MSSVMAESSRRTRPALQGSLWIAQIILAALFGMAGGMKTFLAVPDLLAHGINYASDLPWWLLRFIGVAEMAGAIGIVLPAATRVLPRLTPLAALGFTVLQLLAIGFHATRGELAFALPLNLPLLGLSLFALWGRGAKLPIQART